MANLPLQRWLRLQELHLERLLLQPGFPVGLVHWQFYLRGLGGQDLELDGDDWIDLPKL